MTYLNALLSFLLPSRFSARSEAFYAILTGGREHTVPLREQSVWLVENCTLPSPVRINLLAQFQNVSMAGLGSMIPQSRLLAFFDSELCSVRCGDVFGLEFN